MIAMMMLLAGLTLATALALAFTCLYDIILSATPIQKQLPLLAEATLEDLVGGLQSGAFTSLDLVKVYIARISEINTTLKPVLTLNPDARILAAASDAQRKTASRNGVRLSSLHGIPVLLKDNIATNDRMPTTAGSYALFGARVYEDSTVAAKLRKAGAILLGKTNLSQWSNFRSKNSSHGWSSVGGQTEGAYYPGQDPSGSSSGSGVACALGLAAVCLGTETDGSLVMPAEASNLVGIKPTVGLTSRHLVVPVSEHMDTVGTMSRTVRDAATVLSAIAGPDPNDNYTSVIPFENIPVYQTACDESSLRGKRIGIPRNLFDLTNFKDQDQEHYNYVMAEFDASLNTFRKAGAEIIDNVYLEGYEIMSPSIERNILMADFPSSLSSYLSKTTENEHEIRSLSTLRNFTQKEPIEDWRHHDTELWDDILEAGVNNTSPSFWSDYTTGLYYAGDLGITGALRNLSLDALVAPTSLSIHLPALIGSPVITVPLGSYPRGSSLSRTPYGNLYSVAQNVPFGISFLGDRFSEEILIGMAYAFEQKTRVRERIHPYVRPKMELENIIHK